MLYFMAASTGYRLFADHRRGNEFSIFARYDTSEIEPLENKAIEYFFASDASAVIEHTNQVIFLEVSYWCVLYLSVDPYKNLAWEMRFEESSYFWSDIMVRPQLRKSSTVN